MSDKRYGIGDPIEVRRATPDGEVWVAATVQSVANHAIVAVYADGTRHAVEPANVRPAPPAPADRSEGGR